MVSKRLAERLWKPLTRSNSDIVVAGPWAYVTPIRHVVRGLLQHSLLYEKRGRPEWAAMPLFEPWPTFHLSWGADLTWEIPREVRPDLNAVKAQSDEEHALWLKENYEAWVLPKLRGLGEIRPFFEFAVATDRGGIHRAPVRILFHAALGEFDRVRELAAEHSDQIGPAAVVADAHPPSIELALEVIPLVEREDRAGLADLLHGVEAETARNIGVEHLWERTPFPFQDGGGA